MYAIYVCVLSLGVQLLPKMENSSALYFIIISSFHLLIFARNMKLNVYSASFHFITTNHLKSLVEIDQKYVDTIRYVKHYVNSNCVSM